jgi:TonB dependent receptor/CarboxypepD_reg-like domain/TonB-dependent Receptor Plug Domain
MKSTTKIKKAINTAVLLLVVCVGGFAQTGKLTGKITDSATNQSLFGVSITVKGLSKGVASITDGSYILSLAPGTYTIRYSYSGYGTKDVSEIVIKKGETTFMDATLSSKSDLRGVVITSTRARVETQAAIYSKQKLSAAASDGIGAEAIRKTPDVNVGQVIKRVTGINVTDNRFVVVRGLGDQYNQTMLNGVLMTSTESNRNAFALDLIPAAVLDNITVNKTATPDMPGNFAGGIVQINTKDFPAKDFYSVTLGSGFSDGTLKKDFYSDKRDKLEVLGFKAKSRELPDDFPTVYNRLGGLSGYNTLEQNRYLRKLKNNLAPINYGASKPNESFQLGYGKTISLGNNKQFGIVAAITQRKTELIEEEIIQKDATAPDTSNGNPLFIAPVYYSQNIRYKYSADFGGVLNLAYSFAKNKLTLKTLYTQIFNNTFTERPVAFADDAFSNNAPGNNYYGVTYYIEQKRIINSILSGEHRSGKGDDTRIDWNINTTINNTNTPDIRNYLLQKDSSTMVLSYNNNTADADKALQFNSRIWSRGRDFIYGGAFNITTPFLLFKAKQLFKAGVLFQNRIRRTISAVIVYSNINGTLDSLLAPGNFYTPGLSFLSALTAIGEGTGTFNSGSNLLAAYTSIESKIKKKLRIIWGIRAENYQQYVNVYTPTFYPNFRNFDLQIDGLSAKTSFNFLPSVNLVYALTKKTNIRGAYSITVARPELKDLAEFPRYDYTLFTISQGNKELKSTTIKNYDIKFEFFPNAGEIISVGVFYKKLKGPIEYARNPSLERLVQPFNSGDAYVKGVEAEIRKKLDFIPFAPWLKNISLFGNGTILESKVSTQVINDIIFEKISGHTLLGQPNYIINAGISIAAFKNSFEATVSYNRTGDYIYQLGSADKKSGLLLKFDTRINPRDLMDITISKDLFKNKCKIKINISNVLNSRYIAYQDTNQNGKFDEPLINNLKPSSFSNYITYVSGIENTTSSIKPQRTYSFSINYTF